MSKKFKSQASSARAASNAFGAPSFGFASTSSTSSLSYISEQPDLSTISNPSLVVSLRSLGKKDSTTKAKALEEIQEHVRIAGAEIEDAVINAWVELYPRTSVDNARRVRQLAHTIQGAVTTAAGKRIAPRLPKVIGTWLSGQYDNDRSVARAATDALAVSFATADKRQALWKLYKDSLLDYAEDAILVQTVQTLSDERSTSKDDAESKHARVSGSAMAMLGHLIKANAGSSNFHTKVGHIIQNKVLWEFVSNGDPYLRRSVCTLATLCASEFKDVLDWQVISSRFLYKGLVADQLGSSAQYSASLVTLTTIEPAIWTTFYSGKTSPVKRLCQFFKKGSSRGNEEVWRNHASLLRQIPQAALTKNSDDFALEDAATIAGALYDGVTNSDEPRYNLYAAWSCYIDLTFWLQSLLRTREARSVFFSDHIAGLLTAYVHEPRQATGFPSSSAQRLVAKIISHLREDDSHTFFADLWSRMVSALVEQMRVSLPESSHDFRTSQDAVAASSSRLFKTRSACTENTSFLDSQAISEAFRSGDELLFATAIDLLSNRNGKPYGAASVLSDLVSLQNFNKSDTKLNAFLESNIDQLLHSPSADKAVSLWRSCGYAAGLLLRSLLANQPLDERSEKAVTTILASALPDDIDADSDVVNALCSTESVSVTTALLSNSNLHLTQPALYYFEKLLSETSPNASREQQLHAVSALNDIFTNAEAKSAISSTSRAGEIVARLLYLADSPDSKLADAASAALAKLRASPNVTVQGSSTSMTVILDQLSGAQPQISILALVDLALSEYQNAADKLQSAVGLLPTLEQWEAALHSHFVHKRPASLAVSNPLQAVVYTLEASPSRATVLPHDGEDFSMAFRFAIYVSKLCAVPSFMESLSVQSPDALHQYFPLALQLVSEKLSLEEVNELWVNSTPEVLDEAADVLSEGNAAIQQWIANEDSSFVGGWLGRGKELQGNTVEAYMRARAFADIASRSSQQDGGSSIATQFDAQVRQLHRSSELIQSAAIAYSAREYLISSSAGRKVVNELISDATQLKVDTLTITTMKPLVLLNVMLDGDSEALEGIPSQRLVFLMQTLVRLLSAATLDMLVESEIFKLLAVVLPAVQDIYGDHWQDILATLSSTWTELNDSDDDLPMLHSTLRLYQKLKISAGKEDVNEDLQEAWQEKTNDLDTALLKCLHLFGKPDQGINQPRQICAELLGRLLRGVKIGDLEPIYPLLSTPSDAVLETAFSILHEVIPERQEQLSVDLILEKQTIHLPAELMELILDDQDTAIARKRYLICWKLIFRHFEKASYKLREMYVTDLKGKSELSRLLDLCCQTFRITDSRPVDVSKVDDFQTFTPESFQGFGDERGIQHLSINLYYSSLLYTPGLVKTWFIEQKNRIKSPLEAWTQKHITPTIVAASFDTVSEWSQTQDKEDSPVEIKANSRSAELVASMPIDPESPPIAISVILPSAYPLNSPTVVGKTRVAVSDKNWQSWLRTIQIIIFSTGSIIEGLVAFRRNVQGALKGQGECAICYSIIGTDMQTPNKKCGTCKNMFHGACLFKWFKSSNSSTCPLCRNSFSYA